MCYELQNVSIFYRKLKGYLSGEVQTVKKERQRERHPTHFNRQVGSEKIQKWLFNWDLCLLEIYIKT